MITETMTPADWIRREAACPGKCGSTVRWTVPRDLPEEFAPFASMIPWCQTCIDGDELALRAVTRQPAPGDPVRAFLRTIGANLRDHGGVTLDTWDPDPDAHALEAVRSWVETVAAANPGDPVMSMRLWGGTGSGKTQLAVSAARHLHEAHGWRPNHIILDRWPDLLPRLHAHQNEAEGEEMVDRRIRARLWIVDDLGDDPPTAASVRAVTRILRERQSPTLVTGNYGLRSLAGRYQGVDGFDRLVSTMGPGCFESVELRGKDRRMQRRPA
jgi:DNA replication protein DnaC